MARTRSAGPSNSPEETSEEQNAEMVPPELEAGETPRVWTAIQHMMAVQNEVLGQIKKQTAVPPANPVNEVGRPEPGAKQFHELHPKTFSGLGGPLEAEEWVRLTENKLAAARVPQAGWVEVAQLQLTDNASTWWEREERSLIRPIPWGLFKEMLLEKYFPISEKRELARQFANLKQGSMTVDDYVAQYDRLSRFAPHLIETEELKVDHFRQGLHPHIRMAMAMIEPATLADAIKYARNYEKEAKINYGQQTGGNKQNHGSARHGQRPPHGPNRNAQFKRNPAPPQRTFLGNCDYCGRAGHKKKDCRKLLGVCLVCGDASHTVANCPKISVRPPGPPAASALPRPPVNNQQQQKTIVPVGPRAPQKRTFQQDNRPKKQAYTMTVAEAETEEGVITGNPNLGLYIFPSMIE